MDDLSRFCCQNAKCPDYGKRRVGNLSVSDRYGKNDEKRILYCRTCKGRFSERKGTPFFDARLPAAKVVSVLEHLVEDGRRRPRIGIARLAHAPHVDDIAPLRKQLQAVQRSAASWLRSGTSRRRSRGLV